MLGREAKPDALKAEAPADVLAGDAGVKRAPEAAVEQAEAKKPRIEAPPPRPAPRAQLDIECLECCGDVFVRTWTGFQDSPLN